MPVDGAALATALGRAEAFEVHHHLCRSQLGRLTDAAAGGDDIVVACRQEEALFAEIAGEQQNPPQLTTLDIRETAGWSRDAGKAAPKMAALLAQAMLPAPDVPVLSLDSGGRCLIIGDAPQALEAAARLNSILEVTVLVDGGDVLLPLPAGITLLRGRIERLQGYLSAFKAFFEDVAMPRPSARRGLEFEAPRARLEAEFDCVIDLRGMSALLQAPEKRDGYLKPDPGDPLAVERALFDAAQLVGRFEKPRYVHFDESLCAHSRSNRVGCHRCLDHCPTGAIVPNGDYVAVDPGVCAGCGSCAALCPSGAVTYASPDPNHLLDRMRTLLSTYKRAGGGQPCLLIHNCRHGGPLIEAMARYGDGLPAHVIPFEVEEVTQLPLEVILGAIAYGAHSIDALLPWRDAAEAISLQTNIGYANSILDGLSLGDERIRLVFEDDPDALTTVLWEQRAERPLADAGYLALGGKRERLRLALDALHEAATDPPMIVSLPEGAPLGSVEIDVEGCTLCLACVGACPTGALIDNPDAPMLRFLEDACIQCGLCQNTCPEKAIELQPRVNFSNDAKSPRLIKEEEPCYCARCGKAFGVKSSVEKIVAALAAKHSMFQSEEQIARLRMCDDCRVAAQFEAKDNPFSAGPRPETKTTDDYLREREEIEAARARLGSKPS